MKDKLLDIKGTKFIKSRVVGWKRSSEYHHGVSQIYFLDIILDNGGLVHIEVGAGDKYGAMDRPHLYEDIEEYLIKEFELEV